MVRFIRLLLNEKGRFLWSAHRITERQKAGKARSIKGKQLKNSRSTASKPPVAHLSSASAEFSTSQDVSGRCFAREYAVFWAVRSYQKWSVLLRKEQARSTQGTKIASQNKSFQKQEIIPQGVHLLLFYAAQFFLLAFRSC